MRFKVQGTSDAGDASFGIKASPKSPPKEGTSDSDKS
jgi:hypothetical protein